MHHPQNQMHMPIPKMPSNMRNTSSGVASSGSPTHLGSVSRGTRLGIAKSEQCQIFTVFFSRIASLVSIQNIQTPGGGCCEFIQCFIEFITSNDAGPMTIRASGGTLRIFCQLICLSLIVLARQAQKNCNQSELLGRHTSCQKQLSW